MDVELSVRNVELKKLNVGFCNMNVNSECTTLDNIQVKYWIGKTSIN